MSNMYAFEATIRPYKEKSFNIMKSSFIKEEAKPKFGGRSKRERIKKGIITIDRKVSIKKDNLQLIEKITKIISSKMQNKSLFSLNNSSIKAKQLSKNNKAKRQSFNNIREENCSLLMRLMNKKSIYSTVKWEESFQNSQRIMHQIQDITHLRRKEKTKCINETNEQENFRTKMAINNPSLEPIFKPNLFIIPKNEEVLFSKIIRLNSEDYNFSLIRNKKYIK